MTMESLLKDKVALISGSGANIGAACARAFGKEGAQVVLADINVDGAKQVADEIIAVGGRATALPLDLSDEASIKALMTEVVSRFGRIDVLHNNAALTAPAQMAADGALTEMDVDIWDAAFRINTRGTMLMVKHAAPYMIAGGGGSIINTSTGVSILGDIFNPAYSSSKGAVNALTRNIAAQFGRQNIRCNAILPGLVLTPEARKMMSEQQQNMVQRHVLLPRESVPEDIAGAALWLASDMSSFVTGQIISVDGGICHHTPYFADAMDAMSAA